MTRLALPILPGVSGVLLCAAAGQAQTQLQHIATGAPNTFFGHSAAYVGDLNSDGREDFAVGEPGPKGGASPGKVHLYSGLDASLLATLTSAQPGDRWGKVVANAGDVDGDGRDDWAASAPSPVGAGGLNGRVDVYSGASTMLLLSIPAFGDGFGEALTGVGDVNGDGRGDLLIGAPWAFDGGAARVFSGLDGSVIYSYIGPGGEDSLGTTVCALGDLDADGVGDFAIGAPQFHFANGSGFVRVYSGATGAMIREHSGTSGPFGKDFFGFSLDNAGDVDGDLVDDLISGAVPGTVPTYVQVRSGATGALLHHLTGTAGDLFGSSVVGLGDANGDGRSDFGVARRDVRKLDVYSGRDAQRFFTLDLSSMSNISVLALDGRRDIDGDGFPDLLLANPEQQSPTASAPGDVFVFRGYDDPLITYCTAKTNSLGCTPSIGFSGAPTLGGADDFFVTASAVLSHKIGLLAWGLGSAAVPFQGGTLCISSVKRTAPQIASGPAAPVDCSGTYSFHFADAYMSLQGLVAGQILYGQYVSRDPQHPDGTGTGLSDALEFAVRP